jgi:hypothetical protein
LTQDPRVPPLLSPGQISQASGVSYRTVCTDLRHAGLLSRLGPTRFRISASALRERLPDYYDRVFEFFVINTNDSAKSRTFIAVRAGSSRS